MGEAKPDMYAMLETVDDVVPEDRRPSEKEVRRRQSEERLEEAMHRMEGAGDCMKILMSCTD